MEKVRASQLPGVKEIVEDERSSEKLKVYRFVRTDAAKNQPRTATELVPKMTLSEWFKGTR